MGDLVRTRALRSFAMICFALVALTGCSILAPFTDTNTPQDLIGRWTHVGPHGRTAALVFEKYGKLDVKGLPTDVLDSSAESASAIDWSRTTTGAGTWAVDKPYLIIDAGNPSIQQRLLEAASGAGVRSIFIYIGDPDEGLRFSFVKSP